MIDYFDFWYKFFKFMFGIYSPIIKHDESEYLKRRIFTLEKQVKLKGVYSVNDLLSNISNLIGYELVLINPEKDLNMNISNKNDEYFQGTALLTLKNIGNGLGERGKLTVNIDKKLIKLEIR